MIPELIVAFEASAATTPRRIARFSEVSTTSRVALATANTDALIGVFTGIVNAAGDMTDVVMDGVTLIELGGTVTTGAPLTADASGRAIVAVPVVSTTVRVIGFAIEPGVIGDLARVMIVPSLLRTP